MDEENVRFHIYKMEFYSHKKEGSLATCNNIDGPGGHYSKWNEKRKYSMISFICGIQNQKEKQKTPQNLSSYVQRLDLWLPEVGEGGGEKWVKEVKTYKFLIIK